MNITIIGGSGFLGTRLTKRLIESGYNVKISDKRRSVTYADLWVRCDVRNTPDETNEFPEGLISADDLVEGFGIGKMSLRDFIIYFGKTVMQKYFGQDVWVKSTAQNDKRNAEYFEEGFRIYTDIKAPTELSYLIDKQAVIINVERRGYKKKGGLDLLKDDTRWNYSVQIKGNDLMSIKDDIFKIAEEIYYGGSNKENN